MGNKYEVYSYVQDEQSGQGYCYVQVWRGQSFIGMLLVAYKQKRKGVGCVKMEWR